MTATLPVPDDIRGAAVEPFSLAGVVVGALASLSTGLASGTATRMLAGADRLAQLVRDRFTRDPVALAIVDEVATSPTEIARERLTLRLAQQIAADPAFGEALREAVEAAGGRVVQARDSGAVAGGDVRISGRYVAGRDLTIDGSAGDAD